jgi:Phosphotransferase enzyme family
MRTDFSELLELFRPGESASYVVLSAHGRPRWVLPFAGRRVLRSALVVYTPVTPRGLAAWYGARAVASCGLGRILPGRRLSAHPPLKDAVFPLVGLEDGHIAAASSFDGRRGVLCVIDHSARVRAFVKLAWSDGFAEGLQREADALERLKGATAIRFPRVIFSGELEGLTTLIITPVRGRPRLRPDRLGQRLVQASAAIFRLGAELRPLSTALPAMETTNPEWSRLVDETRNVIEPWADRFIPLGLVHGDFAPWNLLEAGRSVGVVDWEEARFVGLPYWDLWHYAVQTATLTRRSRSIRALHRAIRREGPLWLALRSYATNLDIPVDLGSAILPVYLAATGVRQARGDDTDEGNRAEIFRRRLLEEALEAMS